MHIVFFFISQPFSSARAYHVLIDGVFKEIKFSATLVNCLKLCNGFGLRENVAEDKLFIKGLIISICTTDTIKSGADINKDLLKFFKGNKNHAIEFCYEL